MRVLLINGSPHEKGCTYQALRIVATEIERAGISTEVYHIGRGPIAGCTACGACSKLGHRCVVNDGVNEAIRRMQEADGLVIGTPVHYASPAGSLVSFLDRMFYAGNREWFAHKPAAIVASARRAGTTASLDVLAKYPSINQMPLVSSYYWPMVHGSTAEDVLKDEEGVQIMEQLGRNMAWMLRCIRAGQEAGVEVPAYPSPRAWTNFIR